MLLSICEFHENSHTGGHTFLASVNKVTLTVYCEAI